MTAPTESAGPYQVPPATTPAATDGRKVSTAGYWISGAILVLGCGAAIVWFVVVIVGLVTAPENYARVQVPGSAVVSLAEGDWMIYHEYPGASSSSYRLPPSVDVTGPSGRQVSLRSLSGTYTYETGSYEGVAIYEFTAADAGSYTIEADVVGEPGSGRDEIAVGRPYFDGSMIFGIVGSLALGGLCLVAGLVLLIVTIVRRGRARRARTPAMAPYGTASFGAPPAYGSAPGAWPPPQGPGWGQPSPGTQGWPAPTQSPAPTAGPTPTQSPAPTAGPTPTQSPAPTESPWTPPGTPGADDKPPR